ncbi:hypothetical protein BaRGS_00010428 [Batillaria attramentaria]|uniref:Uncharacterized protein n=1 Tax=Batillaria attramentaria TaxID=370345 RepID=A0ABD0LGA7_9CAEN
MLMKENIIYLPQSSRGRFTIGNVLSIGKRQRTLNLLQREGAANGDGETERDLTETMTRASAIDCSNSLSESDKSVHDHVKTG